MATSSYPSKPPRPPVATARGRYDAILSLVLLAATPTAVIAGVVLAVALGFNLGPVLESKQRGGVCLGAAIASTPAVAGILLGLRAHRAGLRGGTAGLVLNGIVAVIVWVLAVTALVA